MEWGGGDGEYGVAQDGTGEEDEYEALLVRQGPISFDCRISYPKVVARRWHQQTRLAAGSARAEACTIAAA